ncbi:hypothetical protein PPERSA_04911 [Pseudocohnilembus persalinus]|uniref:Uncharacterized protein n=1 Tax=Pseudocohnilembus persalinus TaxID=266149 RepID=A0A0V0QJ03_PSEPJ|nr:hypothetical protein PPERSA_04911 [Pseudocohnilembus persalinus]|eukprot:KRX02289.1 hypothetical protein PPERSA_04911 [Pseudocohnilembus persalinus]
MKFDNEYDFENHQKKFCINSEYAKVDKLDEIYQTNKLALRNQDKKELQDIYSYEPLKFQNKYNTPNQKNLTNSNYELELKQYKKYQEKCNTDFNTKNQQTDNGSGLQKTGSQLLGKMQVNLQNQIEGLQKLKEERALNNLNYEDSFLDELILMKDQMTKQYEQDIKNIKKKIVEVETKLKQEPDEYSSLRSFLQELTHLLNYRETLRAEEFTLVKDYEEFQKIKIQNLQRKRIVADMKYNREDNGLEEKQHIIDLKNRKKKLDERRNQIMSKIDNLENRPISQADSVVSMYQERIPSRRNDFNDNYNYQYQTNGSKVTYYNNGRQEKSPESPKFQYIQNQQRDRLRSAGQQLSSNNNNYQNQQYQVHNNSQSIEQKLRQDQKEINIYIPQNENLNPIIEHNNQQQQVGFINSKNNQSNKYENNTKKEEDEETPFSNLAPNREFLAQNQEQSALKTEIQKIVLEQQLQRSKKQFQDQQREKDRQEENERWIDDQRKYLIAQSLRNN